MRASWKKKKHVHLVRLSGYFWLLHAVYRTTVCFWQLAMTRVRRWQEYAGNTESHDCFKSWQNRWSGTCFCLIQNWMLSQNSGRSGHSCFFTEHLTTFTAHFGHCPVIPGDSWPGPSPISWSADRARAAGAAGALAPTRRQRHGSGLLPLRLPGRLPRSFKISSEYQDRIQQLDYHGMI